MNTVIKTGLCLLIAGCLFSVAGCKKKGTQSTPQTPAVQGDETKAAVEVKAEAVKAETAKSDVAQPAAGAIETIPVADIQAEASKMNVEQLKAKAMEYKDAIVAKKAEIEKVAAKLKAIPIAEQMGAEAKSLQTDIATLNKAVTALTERFQVYYNKLKEMGGDVSGLEL
ncbi:MAG: hypothetical protein JW749_12355 [Sedimentisphaerales bacterium]|nr:hypothetical protein [Sedimentisphaerales bacterium]